MVDINYELDVIEFLQTWRNLFNGHKFDSLVELYAAGAILHGTSSPRVYEGREAIRDYFKGEPFVNILEYQISILSNVTAIATGHYTFRSADHGVVIPARFTFVLKIDTHPMVIVHHHSSVVP